MKKLVKETFRLLLLREENGNWHHTRNKKSCGKGNQDNWKSTTLLTSISSSESLSGSFVRFFTITIHKSQTETWLFQSREKIRSSRVTTRDGCSIPFKGHGGKTNKESRAVSPSLQKEEKKSLGEFKRLCGIFCYFSSEQKCWQGKRWNYISYSWSGTRPQAKKGNVLLNVTYWKDGEQKGRRGGRRDRGREGIMTC